MPKPACLIREHAPGWQDSPELGDAGAHPAPAHATGREADSGPTTRWDAAGGDGGTRNDRVTEGRAEQAERESDERTS